MQEIPTATPGRYSREIDVMLEMGWSWQALVGAPGDLVEEIVVRMEKRAKWLAKKRELGG